MLSYLVHIINKFNDIIIRNILFATFFTCRTLTSLFAHGLGRVDISHDELFIHIVIVLNKINIKLNFNGII